MGNYCTASATPLPESSSMIEGTGMPEWVSAAGKELYEQSRGLAQSPYPAYTGQRIATYTDPETGEVSKLTPDEQMAAQILRDGATSYQPFIEKAEESAETLGKGYDKMTREELLGDPFSIKTAQPFLDIYQSAADPAVRDANIAIADQLNLARSKAATGGGGFGSRLALLESSTMGEGAKAVGDIRAAAAKEGLGFAAGRFDADRDARFSAEDTARAAYETEEAARLAKTDQYKEFAPLVQGLQEQAASGLLTAGEAERQLDQAALDLAFADYMDQRQYPQDMLNFALGTLQGVPYDTSGTSTTSGTGYLQQPSIYGQALGGLGALASAYYLNKRA
jgi:hypothetical protein